MNRAELRYAYYSALVQLMKTSPNTPANTAACAECARLYDLDPELCDDVDDALTDDLLMNGGAA